MLTSNGVAPPIASGIAAQVRRLPSLAGDGSPPGGTVQVDLFAAPGSPFALLVGFPGTPVVLPGIAGAVWLRDPVLSQAGVLGNTGRFSLSVPIPASPTLVGGSFAWQALAVDATRASLSNPSSYVHAP